MYSKPDIFDQEKNPLGTQRNLNRLHARKAYQYVSEIDNAFFPEIILNVREAAYVSFSPVARTNGAYGHLSLVKDPRKENKIVISRLDGNHRLWFADGHDAHFDAIERSTSFCILVIPKLETELEIFRAINDNQMGMNTSHLQNINARLLGSQTLKIRDPALYIVKKLQKERESPFFKRVHEGGSVRRGATLTGLTTANLRSAIHDMLARSAKLSQFPDADAQYVVIENYWNALKKWLPEAWEKPSDYIIFRGMGLYAAAYLGVEIIDRALLKRKFQVGDLLSYLKKIPNKEIFLTKTDNRYAGRSGARSMANDLIADLEDEDEISLSKLQKIILGES
jgi:DGQHR domain-containing protein